jgi:hypothetical protein
MKRLVIVVAALLAVVAVGIVLTGSGGDGSRDVEVVSVPAVAEPSIELVKSEVPSPERAAAEAVAMTGEVVTSGLITRRELIESFTTPAFGGELADLTSEQVTSMQLQLAGSGRNVSSLSVAEFPLRVRAVAAAGASATVEVWSVLVIASAGDPVARQAWRTVTVDLELVDDRWLVDGWASVDGPTPAGSPEGAIAPASEVVEQLSWPEVP